MAEYNYYERLGVTRQATRAEIKSAFHRLAKVTHPDGGQGTAALFASVQEAYDVLSDSRRRAAYDREIDSVSGSGFDAAHATSEDHESPDGADGTRPEYEHSASGTAEPFSDAQYFRTSNIYEADPWYLRLFARILDVLMDRVLPVVWLVTKLFIAVAAADASFPTPARPDGLGVTFLRPLTNWLTGTLAQPAAYVGLVVLAAALILVPLGRVVGRFDTAGAVWAIKRGTDIGAAVTVFPWVLAYGVALVVLALMVLIVLGVAWLVIELI